MSKKMIPLILVLLLSLIPSISSAYPAPVMDYSYDGAGRLVKQCNTNLINCQLFNYDQNGNLLSKGKTVSIPVPNAGFEEGANGWSINNATGGIATIDNSTYYTGKQSLKVKVAISGDQYQFKSIDFGTDISGRQFTLSAYVKTSGITGSGVRILTYWQDANDKWVWTSVSSSKEMNGSLGWNKLEATSIAPYGATKLVIEIVPYVNSQGYYWLDNIEVKENASPAVGFTNPSFEDGVTGWSINNANGGTSVIDNAAAHTGKSSLKIKVASSGDQYQFITRDFGSDIAGRAFSISAYVKTEDVYGNGVRILTYWQDDNGWIWSNVAASNYITGTTDWTKLEATAIAPFGAKKLTVLIQPGANGRGSYRVDSVEAVEKPSHSIFITNPSFEEGTANWAINNVVGGSSIIDPTTKHTGAQSLKVKVASSGDQYQFSAFDFNELIAGRKFTISAFVKTSGITGEGVKIITYWQDEQGWIWSNMNASNTVTGTTDWSKLEATGIAPAGAKKLIVIVRPTVNGQGSYWLDSVEVREEK